MRVLLVRLFDIYFGRLHEKNSLVVTSFGQKRYKDSISDIFRVRTVSIQHYDIIKLVIVVIDPYWER